MVEPQPVPFYDLKALHRGLEGQLDAMWADVRGSAEFIGGEHVDGFERVWAAYVGSQHAVGLANGTDAIALSLTAAGLGPGDEVLVPANTFIATAEAVIMAGATPRFVDVDDASLLVTAATLEAGLTPRTRAVIVVHLYGHSADMSALSAFAQEHELILIEDAAQAHGARWEGRHVGTFGVTGTFSFYPGKNLGAFGDGGAVVTDDPAIAEHIRSLGNHGRDDHDRYVHPRRGVNSRLDAVQAGVLAIKLSRLNSWNAARREIAGWYMEALSTVAGVRPVQPPPGSTSVWHLFVVMVSDRAAVQVHLSRAGIQTAVHYPISCHRQKGYAEFAVSLPVAERAAAMVLSLPFHPHMTQDAVQRVVGELDGFLTQRL